MRKQFRWRKGGRVELNYIGGRLRPLLPEAVTGGETAASSRVTSPIASFCAMTGPQKEEGETGAILRHRGPTEAESQARVCQS